MSATEIINQFACDAGEEAIDALKAAGYAVVELPKPDAGTRKLGWEWDTPDVFSVHAGGSGEPFSGGVTINDFGQRVTVTAAEARHAARCLLAAADAAESYDA
jgi:hypothetical protein